MQLELGTSLDTQALMDILSCCSRTKPAKLTSRKLSYTILYYSLALAVELSVCPSVRLSVCVSGGMCKDRQHTASPTGVKWCLAAPTLDQPLPAHLHGNVRGCWPGPGSGPGQGAMQETYCLFRPGHKICKSLNL